MLVDCWHRRPVNQHMPHRLGFVGTHFLVVLSPAYKGSPQGTLFGTLGAVLARFDNDSLLTHVIQAYT